MSKATNEGLKIKIMELCKSNIEQYIKDIELLFKNKSFGHAKGFIVLAFEEIAKIFLLSLKRLGFTSYKMGVEQKINLSKSIYQHKPKLDVTKALLEGLLYADQNEAVWKKYLALRDEICERKRVQSFYVDFDEDTNLVTSPCLAGRDVVTELFEILKIAATNLDFFIYSTPEKDKALREAYKLLEGKTVLKD